MGGCIQQFASAHPGSDRGKAHCVTRRDWTRRRPHRLWLQQSNFCSRSGCHGACSHADEITTSPRTMFHEIETLQNSAACVCNLEPVRYKIVAARLSHKLR